MSTLTLNQGATAIGPGLTVGFSAAGGTSPYSYAVMSGGAGGSINSSTGVYTSPAIVPNNPAQIYDTVQVTDSTSPAAQMAYAQVMVGSPLQLFCDVIQNQMGLANGRVYIFDQKIFQPTDNGLYVIVAPVNIKVISNVNQWDGTNQTSQQWTTCVAVIDVHIVSRDNSALNLKEQVVMAFNSNYARSQGDANSFSIARNPTNFANISNVDGAAIPYHYVVTVNMTYAVPKTQNVPYYSSFTNPPTVYLNQ